MAFNRAIKVDDSLILGRNRFKASSSKLPGTFRTQNLAARINKLAELLVKRVGLHSPLSSFSFRLIGPDLRIGKIGGEDNSLKAPNFKRLGLK